MFDPSEINLPQVGLILRYFVWHCTMTFPMSIDIFEILKIKHSFLTHFVLSQNDYFPSRWCKMVNIFPYFFKYFQIYLHKNVKGRSEKYEIWCAGQLGRVKNKVQKNVFLQAALHLPNICYHFLIATGPFVKLLAYGLSNNSHSNTQKKAKVHFKQFFLKQMNLKKIKLEASIFRMIIS